MKLVPDRSVSPGLVESAAEVGVAGKQFISLMRSCDIVEIRNVEDALGDLAQRRLGKRALIAVVACLVLTLDHVMYAALYSVRSACSFI